MINPLTAIKLASKGKKVAIGVAILIGSIILVITVKHFIDENNKAQRRVGTLETVNTINKGAIENVKKSNEAATNVNTNSDARYNECLQSSRTPENCSK